MVFLTAVKTNLFEDQGGAMSINQKTTCVILVDVQADFTQLKNGSLAVEATGNQYVESVNDATRKLKSKGFTIVATQDFHPENHISFFNRHENKSVLDIIDIDGRSQVLWPPHCVEQSPGAEILVDSNLVDDIVRKGCDPEFDSYSGFFDDGGKATGLEKMLKHSGFKTLIIYGLATDYCVKATALDAVKTGFEAIVLETLCRGVAPDTTELALEQMAHKGIKLFSLDEIFQAVSEEG